MADLEGGLREYRPSTLLAFLAATHKTGMLRVAGHHHTVTVWLADGAAVAADSTHQGDVRLLDQLVDLLRMPAGTFRFTEGDLARPEMAHAPDPDLLPKAVERLHQWEDLADAVPSLSLHVKLLNADGPEVTLSSAAWSVGVAVSGGHGSIASVAKHLKWGAFETCRAVRELVDAGRAELVAPPRRRRGMGAGTGAGAGAKVDAPATTGAWHAANGPLWPGSGSTDRDRFSSQWAYED